MPPKRYDLIVFFIGFVFLIALAWVGSGGQLWTVASAQGGTVPPTPTFPLPSPPLPPSPTPGGVSGGPPPTPGSVGSGSTPQSVKGAPPPPPLGGYPCLDALAFHSTRDNNPEIYVMYGDGSGLSRLTFLDPVDEHPAPSSDGSLIAFDSTRDQANSQIYVMNVDGSNVRRLTTSPAVDRAPNWSSDTHRIAFESNRDGSFQIWTINADGSDARPLTKGSAENHFPSWSWDNAHIVFVSLRDRHEEVYVMNADGSNQTRLTSTPNNGVSGHPTWSRDSFRIAFESNRTGNYEIYVMNFDGSNVKQITNTQLPTPVPPNTPIPLKQNRFPYWVPSCDERIAFSSNRQDPDYRIWVTQPDGSNQRRLVYERPEVLVNPNAPDEHPAWSGAPANLPLFLRVLPAPGSTFTRAAQLAPSASSTPPATQVSNASKSNSPTTALSSADSTSSSSPSTGVNASPGTPPPANNGFFGWLSSLWDWITHK